MRECMLKTLGPPSLLHLSVKQPLTASRQSILLLFLAEKQKPVSRSDIIRNFASEDLAQAEASRQITYLLNRSKKQINKLIGDCPLIDCSIPSFQNYANANYHWLVESDISILRKAHEAKDFQTVLKLLPTLEDNDFAKDFETLIDIASETVNYISSVRSEIRDIWTKAAEMRIHQDFEDGYINQVLVQAPEILKWEFSSTVLDCFYLAMDTINAESKQVYLHQQMCDLIFRNYDINLQSFEACVSLAKENLLTLA